MFFWNVYLEITWNFNGTARKMPRILQRILLRILLRILSRILQRILPEIVWKTPLALLRIMLGHGASRFALDWMVSGINWNVAELADFFKLCNISEIWSSFYGEKTSNVVDFLKLLKFYNINQKSCCIFLNFYEILQLHFIFMMI